MLKICRFRLPNIEILLQKEKRTKEIWRPKIKTRVFEICHGKLRYCQGSNWSQGWYIWRIQWFLWPQWVQLRKSFEWVGICLCLVQFLKKILWNIVYPWNNCIINLAQNVQFMNQNGKDSLPILRNKLGTTWLPHELTVMKRKSYVETWIASLR